MPATGRRPMGRRAGDSGTRAAILAAATALFAERGYDAASIRAIAAEAGVDPALIRHFFGDKDTLYATVLTDREPVFESLVAALQGDPETLGRRLTDTYLRMWENPDTRPVLQALVRSAATSDRAAQMLSALIDSRMRDQPSTVDEPRARRLALAASHLLGLAIARHIVKVPAIVAMSHDELVADVAPTIQRYLADEPGGSRTG